MRVSFIFNCNRVTLALLITKVMDYNVEINGYISDWSNSSGYIKSVMASCKKKPCAVRINSLGGSVIHGLDIRQQFIDHGDVTAYLFGFVASAATIIALGAKTVKMSKSALFLIHCCSNWVDGWESMNSEQISAFIEDLKKTKETCDKIDLVLASIYANKTGKSIEEMHNFMNEEKWITAEEAKELGLVDEIIEDEEEKNDSLANIVAENIQALGFPSLPKTKTEKKPSWLSGLTAKIDKILNSKAPEMKENETPKTTPNKDFGAVNALLKVEALEASEKGVTLTPEQLKAINEKLTANDDAAKQAATTISDLTKQVENLKNEAPEETKKVHAEGDNVENGDDILNVMARAAKMNVLDD